MKFTVEIRDYEQGDKDIDTADIEEAVQALLDEEGSSGIVIVEEVK